MWPGRQPQWLAHAKGQNSYRDASLFGPKRFAAQLVVGLAVAGQLAGKWLNCFDARLSEGPWLGRGWTSTALGHIF
jgi:hypothetical protein